MTILVGYFDGCQWQQVQMLYLNTATALQLLRYRAVFHVKLLTNVN